jgi:signal transduction histidine kinase
MKIKKKIILYFVLTAIIWTAIISVISIYFTRNAYHQFVLAENKNLIPILADRMMLRSTLSFAALILIASIISFPIGLWFFNLISKAYLKFLADVGKIAEKRLRESKQNINKDEKALLKNYVEILLEDQKRLLELEKVNSWKEGARLLLHEIKNPLTPLKLTVQSLEMNELSSDLADDINSIQTSITDIDKIIYSFRELVNIEFLPITEFEFKVFLQELINQNPFLKSLFTEILPNDLIVNSEPTLLKIVFMNLINNGLEANKNGFSVIFTTNNETLRIQFRTSDICIEHINQIFKMGFSRNGKGRGYGLYLCKMISDYLKLNLRAENVKNDVIFSIEIKKRTRK